MYTAFKPIDESKNRKKRKKEICHSTKKFRKR